MLIIWGVRVFFHTAGQGVFHCQRCGGDRRYRRRSGRRFFTLFLIPVIPLATVGEHVQCATCRTRFHPDVLTLPRPSQQGANAGLPAPRDGFAARYSPARHVAGHGVIVKFDNLYRDAVRTAAS